MDIISESEGKVIWLTRSEKNKNKEIICKLKLLFLERLDNVRNENLPHKCLYKVLPHLWSLWYPGWRNAYVTKSKSYSLNILFVLVEVT